MLIDIIFAILVIVAIFKGLRRGFIVAIFSILAFIVGLAAAIKLSAVVAEYLAGSTNISGKWLPFLSFLLVFILVAVVVRIVAKLIEKSVEFAFLGWLNRLLGVALYFALYTIIFSILLFYAVQMQLLKQQTLDASATYLFIQPWGPYVMEGLGAVVPWFRDMFEQLKDFFGKISEQPKA
ncbi:MAG TPA: CvpA family protein [Chitinophagaceae bacterium]|nr:CvpA family protein [Chitinophagaceae bacterium]